MFIVAHPYCAQKGIFEVRFLSGGSFWLSCIQKYVHMRISLFLYYFIETAAYCKFVFKLNIAEAIEWSLGHWDIYILNNFTTYHFVEKYSDFAFVM